MFNLRCIYFRIEINGAPKESYVLRADQAWPAVTLPKTRQKLPPPTLAISSGVKPWSSISPATAWKNPPVRPGQALFKPSEGSCLAHRRAWYWARNRAQSSHRRQ
jgi:hypothetical protein